MSNVAIITDLHFGARGDSLEFDSYFRKFYETVFFPTLADEGISDVYLLGDIFDRRKYINFNILKNCKEYFFDQFKKLGIKVTVIVGNHDVYFKNTNDINSLELVLAEYDNITIYREPIEIQIDGLPVLLCPWINTENAKTSIDMINKTKSLVCFGHFEIAGFEMHAGQVNDHGFDRKMFDRFDMVLSGHFHHKSSDGVINYLGNPYEMTWADYNDVRGFHIFNTDKKELRFIPNPYKMFNKIHYDDTKPMPQPTKELQGKFVKIIVVAKTDFYKFDKYMDALYLMNPAEVKIIDDFGDVDETTVDEDVDVEDTVSLLGHYVDAIETDMDKGRLKDLLKTLYLEAQNMDRDD